MTSDVLQTLEIDDIYKKRVFSCVPGASVYVKIADGRHTEDTSRHLFMAEKADLEFLPSEERAREIYFKSVSSKNHVEFVDKRGKQSLDPAESKALEYWNEVVSEFIKVRMD